MSPLQYVVLHHEGIPRPHFDLMFETSSDSMLCSVRLSEWPSTSTTRIERLEDHRRIYLDFEGSISGNRGRVHRVAAGTCRIEPAGDSFLVHLETGATIRVPPKD